MGVKGLQSFAKKNVPNGFTKVNILDEIEKLKSKQSSGESTKPILIFDVMGFLGSLGGNHIELLCGGRHNVYLQKVRVFFESLSHEAELVFICDGHVRQDKLERWIRNKEVEYESSQEILDGIRKGDELGSFFNNHDRCCKSVTNSIILCAADFGKVIITNGYDCDATIAKYAYEHNALAVFTRDTDFLIFKGKWRFWQSGSIDFEHLTTYEFNRVALLDYLKLSREQMPLFATIVGNDYKEELPIQKQFKVGKKISKLFPVIANYVRNTDLSNEEELCCDLFQGKLNTVIKNNFKKSLKSYDIDFEIAPDENPVNTYTRKNVFMSSIWSKEIFQYEINFIDLRDALNKNTSVSFIDVILNVFRKLSGIILFHTPDRKFKMLTKRASEERYEVKEEEVILPSTEKIPELSELIFNNKKTENKWNLLMWSLSLDEDFQWRLKDIHKNFSMSALAISFLLKSNLITPLEADALMTVECVKNNSYNANKNIQPERLNARIVQVSQFYNRAMCLVWDCLVICGLNEIIVPFKFDGFDFHCTLKQFEKSKRSYTDAKTKITERGLRVYTVLV